MQNTPIAPDIESDLSQLPLPPLAKGLPVLGSALEMASKPVDFWVEQYNQMGPVFRVKALNRHFTVMAGPEAVQFIVKMRDGVVSSHGTWADFAAESNAPHMMTMLDGESHTRQRRIMRPGVSRSAIVGRFADVLQITDEVTNDYFQAGQSYSAMSFFQLLICNQLGLMLAGRVAGDYMQDIVTTIRTRLNTLVLKNQPRLALKLPGYRRASARMLEFGRLIVAERRARPAPETPDLVDDLMAAMDNELSDCTESDLENMVLSPFIAGLDTVASTCNFVLYALLKNPQALERVVQEADRLFADGIPTPDTLEQMTDLHGAVMESLRLYPVAGILPRTALRDFAFEGHRITKGSEILAAVMVSHFLPRFYPEPYTFNIDRYRAPYHQHRQQGAFTPFGIGSHTCLGAGLAEIQIMLTMAALLHRYEFELTTPDYEGKLEQNPTLTLGYKFQVRVKALRHAPITATP